MSSNGIGKMVIKGCPITGLEKPCYEDLCPWYMHLKDDTDVHGCAVAVIAESMSLKDGMFMAYVTNK